VGRRHPLNGFPDHCHHSKRIGRSVLLIYADKNQEQQDLVKYCTTPIRIISPRRHHHNSVASISSWPRSLSIRSSVPLPSSLLAPDCFLVVTMDAYPSYFGSFLFVTLFGYLCLPTSPLHTYSPLCLHRYKNSLRPFSRSCSLRAFILFSFFVFPLGLGYSYGYTLSSKTP